MIKQLLHHHQANNIPCFFGSDICTYELKRLFIIGYSTGHKNQRVLTLAPNKQ